MLYKYDTYVSFVLSKERKNSYLTKLNKFRGQQN